VHLITSTEVGRLSRRRGPQPYERLNARLLMRVESVFFHDHKKSRGIEISGSIFLSLLNFELIAVSVIKSSLRPAAYPLLCRKSLFFNVNKSK
jgi:hypothetical protein